jgi:hypothetical protein
MRWVTLSLFHQLGIELECASERVFRLQEPAASIIDQRQLDREITPLSPL